MEFPRKKLKNEIRVFKKLVHLEINNIKINNKSLIKNHQLIFNL